MDDSGVYKRMLDRERQARRDAEKFLEQKSLELYEANQRLQEALALYRRDAFYLKTVLDSATDGILTINATRKVDTANPSACRIFERSSEQMIGADAATLVATDALSRRPASENHFFADFCTAKQPTIEAIGKRSDGELIDLELSASYGEIDGAEVVTWVLRDTSSIRAMQRQADLSQRLAGIGELAAGIAHEINTPVQFVHENTKFLAEAFEAMERVLIVYEARSEPTDELRAAIEEACPQGKLVFYRSEAHSAFQETEAGAKRIAKIVSAVKEFSHPGEEKKTLVDLNRASESAATVTASQWKDVAELDLNLAKDLPTIDGYSAQINQVLVNLLVNAADAIRDRSDAAQNEGTITITTGTHDDHVFVAVRDTGMGIEPENIERVCLPFFTTKAVGKGTGQGLSITHSIVVENHGGSIDIQSAPGKGSVFTIYFPRSTESFHDDSV